jgi:flagellar M-ring protein FliF
MPAGAALAGAGAEGGATAVPAGEAGSEPRPALGADGKPVQLSGPAAYEDTMEAARKLVDNDPKRVAQLVKTWIAEDAS